MPRPNIKLPEVNQKVRFRVEGDNNLWYGIYNKIGFQICICDVYFTMCRVDYWQYDNG